MCELFGVSTPQKIQLNSLLRTFFSHADKHPHGWGMVLFDKKVVCVEKQAVSADKSARLQSYLENPVIADNMMAHIRLATKGNMEYDNYADSVERYVQEGMLKAPSELYYPIRLKPAGENNLDSLRENGVNHIELRMFDLNPLRDEGVELRDLLFAQLLMVWLACQPELELSPRHQIQAVQNFKNAAHYDLKTVKIALPDGSICSVAQAAMNMIDEMKCFYREHQIDVQEVLDFEYDKFVDGDHRYAWQIRQQFQGGYVRKGMELAKKRVEVSRMQKK